MFDIEFGECGSVRLSCLEGSSGISAPGWPTCRQETDSN